MARRKKKRNKWGNTTLGERVTLALYPSWMPSHFLTKKHCFELLMRDDAVRPLDSNYRDLKSNLWFELGNEFKFEGLPVIRSAHDEFLIPSIVVLTNRHMDEKSVATSGMKMSKHDMCERFDYTCQKCDQIFSKKELTVDHLDPYSVSQNNEDFNLTLMCKKCNNEKADMQGVVKNIHGEIIKGLWIGDYVIQNFHVKEKDYREEWGKFFIGKKG